MTTTHPNYHRSRFALTLIEVMLAMTLSLVMMLALAATFKLIGDRITKSQFATVETLYRSEDQMEGARAFSERRDPVWKGK